MGEVEIIPSGTTHIFQINLFLILIITAGLVDSTSRERKGSLNRSWDSRSNSFKANLNSSFSSKANLSSSFKDNPSSSSKNRSNCSKVNHNKSKVNHNKSKVNHNSSSSKSACLRWGGRAVILSKCSST